VANGKHDARHDRPPPNIGPPENLAEQRGLQTEIKQTLKRINDLQDAQVDKDTEVAEIIKRAKHPRAIRETFYHRKQRVDSLFNATVTSADIVQFIQTLVQRAKDGDLDAIRIILDRLAGKAPAFVDVTSAGEKLGDMKIDLVLDVSRGPSMAAIEEGDARVITASEPTSGSATAKPAADRSE
jgi:CRISPR/Cas system-associated endoribonuclease Cas2